MEPISVEDYRKLARRRLPARVFDYLEGGSEDEVGLKFNRDTLRGVRFRPRRLRDVSRRDLTTTLWGKSLSAPLIIAPTGLNSLFWPKGDIALARAAAREGIPFVLSTASNISIEELARQCDGDLWFQLYVANWISAESMVKRALAAGYSTLVLTVDVLINGNRERDRRHDFSWPIRYSPAAILDALWHPRWSLDWVRHAGPQLANFMNVETDKDGARIALEKRQMDASFDWRDLARLRDLWPHRLLVKGITHPEDAERCAACGVDGIILSNHGGRQLDSCLSPIEILAATAAKVDRPILVDSGFRRGSEVVKAVALGASAVLLGRATLYGLAAAGDAGVVDVLRILRKEIDVTLAQIGCTSIPELSSEYLVGDSDAVEAWLRSKQLS
jgi:(S)-mandelate dehydrogenase